MSIAIDSKPLSLLTPNQTVPVPTVGLGEAV